MKKNNDGLYEATKFIALFNETLVGTGKTKEEAKADLKKKLKEYRKAPSLVVTGTFPSPGYEAREVNGITQYKNNPNRRGVMLARPSLAAHLIQERAKENK